MSFVRNEFLVSVFGGSLPFFLSHVKFYKSYTLFDIKTARGNCGINRDGESHHRNNLDVALEYLNLRGVILSLDFSSRILWQVFTRKSCCFNLFRQPFVCTGRLRNFRHPAEFGYMSQLLPFQKMNL